MRSKLWLHAKQFKDEGCKVALDYDRLRVDNDVYTWDEENASPLLLRQQKQGNQESASSWTDNKYLRIALLNARSLVNKAR